MFGDGCAIVGETIGAVAECPATTGGAPIPVLVIEFLDLASIRRCFVFPGWRCTVVVVIGTGLIMMLSVLGGLETLFHFVV